MSCKADKGELNHIVTNYLSEKKISYLGNAKKEINELIEFIPFMKSSEEPDIYAIYEDKVLILEHFEIDSTKSNRKGSQYRQEESRIDRKINSLSFNESNIIYYSDKLNINQNITGFIENTKFIFLNHYTKIDSYILNLKNHKVINESSTVSKGFFIEDVTPLGNLCDINGKTQTFNLFLCKEFLDIFESSTNLDFILYSFYINNGEYALYYINRDTISEYRKNQYSINQVKIYDMKPHVTGIKALISKEDIENSN